MKSIYTLFSFSIIIFTACTSIPGNTPVVTVSTSPQPSTATPTTIWFQPTTTSTSFPTQFLIPTAEMRPGIGEIVYEDKFEDPAVWNLFSTDGGNIALGRNEITIAISSSRKYLYSIREDWEIYDFYLEITVNPNLCHDDDEYGLLLRVSPEGDYYRYSLSCDGRVRLDRIYQNQASSPQPWLVSGSFPPGAPSMSRLGVWALGDEMRFFVNEEYQFTVFDPLLKSGKFGVFARSMGEFAVTVNFSDLVVREVRSQ